MAARGGGDEVAARELRATSRELRAIGKIESRRGISGFGGNFGCSWLEARSSQLIYNPSHMPEPPKPPGGKDPLVALARYSEIGFIIPAAVLLGFFLGKGLDYWLHTKWLYLVGLLFGAVVGFTQVIRMAMSSSKDD